MLDNLGLVIGSIFLVLGAFLLYDGLFTLEATRSLMVIGGAGLISFGTMMIALMLKNKLEWRRNLKKYRTDFEDR
jgi:flagellar motor component MotA